MYEELIKSLRICAIAERDYECAGCAYRDKDFDCNSVMKIDAADAIDELQQIAGHYEETAKDYFKDVCYYLERVPKWISVKERLPEHLTSVIVHRKDGGIFMWEYFNTSQTDDCWIDDSMNVYSFYDVTHWMPLPEPPKEDEA